LSAGAISAVGAAEGVVGVGAGHVIVVGGPPASARVCTASAIFPADVGADTAVSTARAATKALPAARMARAGTVVDEGSPLCLMGCESIRQVGAGLEGAA
jgi:hypothetical protein